ncbi:MAG: hypothetical protein ACLVL2_06175 [Bacteroides cellulosilyticus]
MKRTNVLQALIFSIVILFGGTACDNANDERFSSTEEFTVEGDASSLRDPDDQNQLDCGFRYVSGWRHHDR